MEDRDQHRHRELRVEAQGDVAADHQQREDQRLAGRCRRPAGRRSGRRWCSRSRLSPTPNSALERRCGVADLARLELVRLDLEDVVAEVRVARPAGSPRRSIPASSSESRTPSSSVGLASATLIRVPDSKSMPKLSCLVASASAPTSRITPEIEKNQRLAPMKSKCQRMPSPRGAERARRAQQPRAAHAAEQRLGEDDRGQQRDDRADAEREGEALDPRGREHEEDEGGQQGDDVGVDDRADPAFVAGGDRARHRAPRPDLLLYSLEDDDVRVGGDADRQHQPGDPRQGQGDRDQFDQGEEDDRVGAERDRARSGRGSGSRGAGRGSTSGEADEPRLEPVVERLAAERRRDLGLADQLEVDRQGADLQEVVARSCASLER